MKQRKKWKLVVVILVVVLIITAAVAFYLPVGANITRDEAHQIALDLVGGGFANPPDIDLERFQRTWYVEVFYEGLVHSIYINTQSGEIVSREVESWD